MKGEAPMMGDMPEDIVNGTYVFYEPHTTESKWSHKEGVKPENLSKGYGFFKANMDEGNIGSLIVNTINEHGPVFLFHIRENPEDKPKSMWITELIGEYGRLTRINAPNTERACAILAMIVLAHTRSEIIEVRNHLAAFVHKHQTDTLGGASRQLIHKELLLEFVNFARLYNEYEELSDEDKQKSVFSIVDVWDERAIMYAKILSKNVMHKNDDLIGTFRAIMCSPSFKTVKDVLKIKRSIEKMTCLDALAYCPINRNGIEVF